MSTIKVTVPDGDYCVAAGVRCKFVQYINPCESEVVKAYPGCLVYGNALDMVINKNGHSVVKCDRCFMESKEERYER
jgi:hypothetical protein